MKKIEELVHAYYWLGVARREERITDEEYERLTKKIADRLLKIIRKELRK
jgi:hypothetical protein